MNGNNIITVNDVTEEDCMERCRSEKTFHCKSIDYNRPGRFCYLAIVDRDTVALNVWKDYNYYELSCERKLGLLPLSDEY